MLTHIHIRDFAIIERADLELQSGATVITGETGAGKSILVDALELALGDRADSGAVRHGAERAEIHLSFQVDGNPDAIRWLREHDLGTDGECMIRRVIHREGRSKGFINDRPVSVQSLKALGEMLVDIHGQHEHQSLLRREVQRQLLDDFADHGSLVAEVGRLHGEWKTVEEELHRLREAARDREDRLSLLRYQVQELEAAAPDPGEIAELEEEHARLANAGRLLEAARQSLDVLYESDEASVHGLLSRIAAELEPLAAVDARLGPVCELINGALIQVQEGAEALRRHAEGIDLVPERLAWVEQRMADLHDLARKHRARPEELPGLLARLQDELATLENAAQHMDALAERLDAVADAYRRAARELGESRRRAAAALGERVTAVMQELGMPGGRFQVRVETPDDARFTPHGLDRIEFLVSANPGQPPRPLAKVASGGELSRISLAFQVVAAGAGRIPCLIFDEVDSGVGGGVAEIVGRRLRSLGESRQVLCVTHLPQVAVQAHHHLKVTKFVDGGNTRTRVERLDGEARVREIARMLGGVEITDQTLAHAREMLEAARTNDGGRRRGPSKGRSKASAG